MRHVHFISCVALVAATVLSGCRTEQQVAQNDTNNYLTLPSGTSVDVTLVTPLTSKTASVGTAWTGTTRTASVLDGRNVIPAGSAVSGTVSAVKAAQKGDRAMLDLGLTSITVAGHRYTVHGSTEAIIAGSTRARNLGAIAGSAAGGALIGKAVSGTGKGALIGGVIGGGVATGVVAASDGYQVVLKQGTPLTFTTSERVAVRL
jgi:hypothetical protein